MGVSRQLIKPCTRPANPRKSHDLNRGLYPWEAMHQSQPMALAVGKLRKPMPKFFKSLNPYTQEIVGEYMEASAIQIEVKLE